jgi:hypothetical protein
MPPMTLADRSATASSGFLPRNPFESCERSLGTHLRPACRPPEAPAQPGFTVLVLERV